MAKIKFGFAAPEAVYIFFEPLIEKPSGRWKAFFGLLLYILPVVHFFSAFCLWHFFR